MSHGRFHDILPKEYSEALPELLLGPIKRDALLTMGSVTLATLISEIKYILSKGFFTTKVVNLKRITSGACFQKIFR